MKIIFSVLSLTFILNSHYLLGGHPLLKGADSESKALVEDISRFPKAMDLIHQATKEGMITVKICKNRHMPFEAMWESNTREITLDGNNMNRGCLIRHVIFELQNAVSAREDALLLQMARLGNISCDHYVQGVEKIEHQNVLKTARLIEEGIIAGKFPRDAHWEVVHDFDLHYKIQQLTGHSDTIVEEYKHFCPEKYLAHPYRGTIVKKHSQHANQQWAAQLYEHYIRGI